MFFKCEAIVENGLLRPLVDLGLSEADHVILTVETIGPTAAARPDARARLAAAASALVEDYAGGGNLTAFTTLDGEDFCDPK